MSLPYPHHFDSMCIWCYCFFPCEGLYLELNWFMAWVTCAEYQSNHSENICSEIFLWLPSHLLPLDLLKCSRQARKWLAFIFYLILKFFRWIMGFLIVKSPFLETSFSRNPICFQIFYLKNVFLCHFCYAHVANPGLEWQEADFRARAGWPRDTCCAGGECEMSGMCCLFPSVARWKAQLLPRPRISMALSRGLEFPGLLLSSSTWFTLCEALTLGPQESIPIL